MNRPLVALSHLDELWFQAGGTRCNYTCKHCFIHCSPHNTSFGFLSLAAVEKALEESVALGVKEYYFTGGEPFLNPDLVPMLVAALKLGPASVLTNASVLRDAWLETLRAAEEAGPYSLEFRVSLDGFTAETNDPLRGTGTFDRTLRGCLKLVRFGFLPIVTAVRTWPLEDEDSIVAGFVARLKAGGYARPRLKIVPRLALGAEADRTGGYLPDERVTADLLADIPPETLLCDHARVVSDRGVHVCPILLELPAARLGGTLAESLGPFAIEHGACWTCYRYGAICSNPSRGTALPGGT